MEPELSAFFLGGSLAGLEKDAGRERCQIKSFEPNHHPEKTHYFFSKFRMNRVPIRTPIAIKPRVLFTTPNTPVCPSASSYKKSPNILVKKIDRLTTGEFALAVIEGDLYSESSGIQPNGFGTSWRMNSPVPLKQ
jgi:hypothetical protein